MRRSRISTTHGLGQEPNNLAAIDSLKGYRALRWGRNVDLIITDQRSYRSEEPDRPSGSRSVSPPQHFPEFMPQEAMEILDAGRTYDGGKPPRSIRFGDKEIANFRKDQPPQTILGAEQKAWFLDASARLARDLEDLGQHRRHARHARRSAKSAGRTDRTVAGRRLRGLWRRRSQQRLRASAREIYDFVRDAGHHRLRHRGRRSPQLLGGAGGEVASAESISSPWASLSSPARSPRPDWWKHSNTASRKIIRCDRCLSAKAGGPAPQPTVNLLLRHGVRSCLEYQRSGDLAKARAASNPDLSPHLSFVDMGGHGYALVHVNSTTLETEFVCIPRPLERSEGADGGPLVYRVKHKAKLWEKGAASET